ncbi:MAG: choice-of-anchor E domain-containing protein [Caldilineaceae bacterium]|nr:choice-of-anchor E domain-containing protein [Caldilineaceae bacterium]
MRLPSPRSIVAAIFAVLFLALFAPQNLYAEEITHQDEIPMHATTWTDSLSVPQFNPAVGDLLEVTISVNGVVSGSAEYENLNPNAVPITLTHAVTMSIDMPSGANIHLLPSRSFSALIPGFDGIEDYGGTSGDKLTLEGSEVVTFTYSDLPNLVPFIGNGNVDIPVTAKGVTDAQGPGNFAATLLSNSSGAALTVRYRYTVPTVERVPNIVIEKLTNGVDADSATDPTVPLIQPGDPITWSYVVTNTGNVTFAQNQITVTDSQADITPVLVTSSDNGDTLLSPGESWIYRAFGFAENLQAPPATITVVDGCAAAGGSTAGAYENMGVVQVSDLRDEDPSHYCNPLQPGIVIEKLTNGADADDANGNDVPQIQPGDLVTWTYIVTNTGAITFSRSEIRVTDSQADVTPQWIASSDNGDNLLAPGESWRYQAVDVALNLLFTLEGITTVDGCDPTSSGDTRSAYENIGVVQVNEINDSDPSHYCNPPSIVVRNPGIAIIKLTNGLDANNADDELPFIKPDGIVTWTYVVTNTGDVAFTADEIRVTDSDPSVTPVLDEASDVGGDAILAPGESWRYIATGTALDLQGEHEGVTIIPGFCLPAIEGRRQPAYENVGAVQAGDQQASDPSHYCNIVPTAIEQGNEPAKLKQLFIPIARH